LISLALQAVEQIAIADRVIINKVDLAAEEDVLKVESEVKSINPFAQILRSQFSKVPVSEVLDVKAFNIDKVLQQDDGFLDMRYVLTNCNTFMRFILIKTRRSSFVVIIFLILLSTDHSVAMILMLKLWILKEVDMWN
jgi:hypothetical protein